MSLTTKGSHLLVAAIAAATLFGCGSDGHGVALYPTVKPPKPESEMTFEEKKERIEKLPVPQPEKDKMLKDLEATKK